MTLKSFDEMEHHPVSEKLVSILTDKTHNPNRLFFRNMVAYYLSVITSMMRVSVRSYDGKNIPVNMYLINLSPSGTGKGYSTNLIENEIINGFRERFIEQTFPLSAMENIPKVAVKRAGRTGKDPDEISDQIQKEFDDYGPLAFSFDSATSAAIKQMRSKLLLANAGSMNLQIDEIGSNILSNGEALNTFLELFDVGRIKQKLTKNTKDNVRSEDVNGVTPANMLLFGTPVNLLSGDKVEEEFFSMQETGYARRCFFCYSNDSLQTPDMTPEEILDMHNNDDTADFMSDLSMKLTELADPALVHRVLHLDREVALSLIAYRKNCEMRANDLPEPQQVAKAEMAHRYFKVLKLAGTYAFVDGSPEIGIEHLESAIKLAEESGASFYKLLNRDRNYVRLAKYIGTVGRPVTQSDLVEDLPFYKGPNAAKTDMMNLAIAYAYQNHILIRKSYENGVEFLAGEALKETDLNNMVLSYSNDIAHNYLADTAPFDQLHLLTQAKGMHWCNHKFTNGHRQDDNVIKGFNLLVFDVDGTISMDTAKELLRDYKALYYTTKRHTEKENRFRIVMPTSHFLELDSADYKEFMKSIGEWLPFDTDIQTFQRARKWLSHDGHYEYTEGDSLNVLPFIPRTTKFEEQKAYFDKLKSMDNLERWVIRTSGTGTRNNQLFRYAMILIDEGYDFDSIKNKVCDLNDKLENKLDENEIMTTIMISVTKEMGKRLSK